MKKFKQFLRKYKWYRWCEANSIKAHIIFSTIIAQSFWIYLIFKHVDEAIMYGFITSTILFILKELFDIGDTGFSLYDLFINYLTWVVVMLINIVIFILLYYTTNLWRY